LGEFEMSSGSQEIRWDGRDGAARVLPTGIYLARITTGSATRTLRFAIIR
jgi:hypothetical protein